jgi:hypothetical protein
MQNSSERKLGKKPFHVIITKRFYKSRLSLLLRKKLIGLPLVEKILRWRHTGFSVHSKVRAVSATGSPTGLMAAEKSGECF